MSSVSTHLPVLVAGGGIGGLAAALALVRQGFAVTVLEQAPEIGEIGAGIQIGPNGFHAFDALGVGDKARGGLVPSHVFERSKKAYPMLRYAWKDAKAALESLASDDGGLEQVQVTYTNPETGGDAENILGFYALMLRPGQTLHLPARSPAQVFHVIEGSVQAQIVASTFTLLEADTCCAPGYEAVTLTNLNADQPAFIFIADESPLHRKLGVYENRG